MKSVKHAPLNLLHSVMNSLNPSLCNRNYSTQNLRSKRFRLPQHRVLQVPGFKQWELTRCQAFLLSFKYHQKSTNISCLCLYLLNTTIFLSFSISNDSFCLSLLFHYVTVQCIFLFSSTFHSVVRTFHVITVINLYSNYLCFMLRKKILMMPHENSAHISPVQLPFAIREYKFCFKATRCRKSGRRN